jgi:hypothetical protein
MTLALHFNHNDTNNNAEFKHFPPNSLPHSARGQQNQQDSHKKRLLVNARTLKAMPLWAVLHVGILFLF